MDDLSEAIIALLTQIIDSGAKMPISLVCVGLDGSMKYSRYRTNDQGAADCEVLAETISAQGFALPINLMFIDARGEAYRAALLHAEPARFLH
jgi:energy-coupling factor transporter transmembrane protein EcfT